MLTWVHRVTFPTFMLFSDFAPSSVVLKFLTVIVLSFRILKFRMQFWFISVLMRARLAAQPVAQPPAQPPAQPAVQPVARPPPQRKPRERVTEHDAQTIWATLQSQGTAVAKTLCCETLGYSESTFY
jgi:hypothetical protein